MAINMITGYTGEPHVTSSQAGAGNAGMYGTDRYILNVLEKLDYELISNNLIRIKSGMILNQGRLMGIDYNDYVDLEIDNGQSGKKRCDLVVCTYSKNVENGIESAALKIVKGTSGDDYVVPEYETGNILANAVLDDFPLYKIYIDGLSVDSVTKIADVGVNITNISTQITQLQTLTTKLSQDVAILKQGFQRQLFSGAQKTGSIQLEGKHININILSCISIQALQALLLELVYSLFLKLRRLSRLDYLLILLPIITTVHIWVSFPLLMS